MKSRTALALATLLTASAAAHAQTTRKFTATKDNDFGLVYSLPTTVLDITIEVDHTVKRPGEFYQYSRKYLNEERPVTAPSDEWRIKSVKVNARGVANPKEQYLMTFKGGDPAVTLYMADNNVPLAINTDDFELPDPPVLPLPVEAGPTPLEGPAARQAVTAEMLQSQSTAKRAELAAAKIADLRQSRNDLITGQADQMPPDGKAMQLILDQLEAQEAALTAMFLGTEQHSTTVTTFTYVPGDNVSRHVLARLSVFDGLTSPDNLSGDPVTLALKVVERGKMPVNEKGEVKEFPRGGVAYMIPGTGSLTISYGGATIWEGTFQAAQYGVPFGLDPRMFTDKKAPSYLILDPVTGAIKELGSN